MEQLETFISEANKSKIMVLVIDNNNQRRKLHQYMEKVSKIKSVGLYCKHFSADNYVRFKKCYNCDNKVIIKSQNYRYGVLDSNKDEYYY